MKSRLAFPDVRVHSHNLGVAVHQQKQQFASGLLSEQDRFDERRLAASFLQMAGALPRRPEPKHIWHNAASPGRVAYRGRVLLISGRTVMRTAIAAGDRTVIEDSALRVDHHFTDLRAFALADYTRLAEGAVSFDEAVENAARATGDTAYALTRLALVQDTEAHDDAIREIDAEVLRLSALRAHLVSRVTVRAPRRAFA